MYPKCSECRYHKTATRMLNLTGQIETMNISECFQKDNKRANNGHCPTTDFARNKHFGVCGPEGILHVPKVIPQAERQVFVNYAMKRVTARVKAQDELNLQL